MLIKGLLGQMMMRLASWIASSTPGAGRADSTPANRISLLNVGAGEVISILVRKRNAGIISIPDFGQAVANFARLFRLE